jgi:hypothetical protein
MPTVRAIWRGRWPLIAAFTAAGVAFTILAIGVAGVHRPGIPRRLVGELALETKGVRRVTPRLSISPDEPSCTGPESGSACAVSATAPPLSEEITSIGVRASRAMRTSGDPDALHAAALIDLLYDDKPGKSLQRSISTLQTAVRLANRPAPVLADLAAAYLIRAERAHTPRDLLAAIEAAEEALEREPANRAALFNRALALQRFGLVEVAETTWRDYLMMDSVSAWAGEARRNMRQANEDLMGAPRLPSSAAADRAYVAADPQGARMLGWCGILGGWADATLKGDTTAAEEHLRRAGVAPRRGRHFGR